MSDPAQEVFKKYLSPAFHKANVEAFGAMVTKTYLKPGIMAQPRGPACRPRPASTRVEEAPPLPPRVEDVDRSRARPGELEEAGGGE